MNKVSIFVRYTYIFIPKRTNNQLHLRTTSIVVLNRIVSAWSRARITSLRKPHSESPHSSRTTLYQPDRSREIVNDNQQHTLYTMRPIRKPAKCMWSLLFHFWPHTMRGGRAPHKRKQYAEASMLYSIGVWSAHVYTSRRKKLHKPHQNTYWRKDARN